MKIVPARQFFFLLERAAKAIPLTLVFLFCACQTVQSLFLGTMLWSTSTSSKLFCDWPCSINIPRSLSAGMSPCRSARKLLSKRLQSFPGRQWRWHMRPFDEDFFHRTGIRGPVALKNSFRNLESGVSRWQISGHISITMGGFKLGHMKNWVNSRTRQKCQSISYCTNSIQDLIGPKEAECKLLMRAAGQWSLDIRL